MTEIKAGNFYVCLKDIKGYVAFTMGKVYPSLYDNALVNDNCIEVLVRPSDRFRVATKQELTEQKGESKINKGESKVKGGWLNYNLMSSEIGLYHDNAIRRMKEHEDKFNKLSIPLLYHVAEYYEALGIVVVCNCLKQYCQDFTFTEEEIKEIIREEMKEIIEKEKVK